MKINLADIPEELKSYFSHDPTFVVIYASNKPVDKMYLHKGGRWSHEP